MATSNPRCNCCGFFIEPQAEDDCPYCGYPIDPEVSTKVGTQPLSTPYTPPVQTTPSQLATSNAFSAFSVGIDVPATSLQPASEGVFSLKSFFADQTINIIASLGAFLLLLGSLSFVITTSDLLQSFIVMVIVHGVFGVSGAISYRFRSFHVVAVIYTAIFALQVPLVGLAAYRLVAGHFVQLTVPNLVVITAAYAAIAYGWLAIYQKFELFAYLYVVSLAILDLAVCSSLHLAYWWWPGMLMLLGLPTLISETRTSYLLQPFIEGMAVLNRPVRLLMFSCVCACCSGVLITALYSLSIDVFDRPNLEIRFAIVYMLVLLLCWVTLFVWSTGHTRFASLLPYLFLACVVACSYAFTFNQTGYALAFTAVAVLYHGFKRFVPQLLWPFPDLGRDLEWIALVLVALVPWIVSPVLPVQIFTYAYQTSLLNFQVTGATVVALATLLVGLALTFSVIESHTGLRKVPVVTQSSWCWLLLLSGFILDWTYSIVILSLHAEPVWCFLGLMLILVILAVVVRRFASAVWADPLDVLVFVTLNLTLLLSLNRGTAFILALLLSFAALSYAIALYQFCPNALWLSFIFGMLAYLPLLDHPRILLVLSILLPLILAGMYLLISRYWRTDKAQLQQFGMAFWVWPLLVIGPLYGMAFFGHDTLAPMSTMQSWLGTPFSVALELAALALVWYISAALARVRVWLLIMMAFAVLALLSASNMFWWLVGVAPILAILALGISRLAGRTWALPLYGLAVLAEVIVGWTSYSQGLIAAAVWALLGFAILVYLIGVAERSMILAQVLIWAAAFFACWSVYYSGVCGDYFFPPLVAVMCAVVGVGIGYLRFVVPSSSPAAQRQKLLLYALPCYATALVAALLTGIYGVLFGINVPFYGAVPDALLVYALVTYGILLSEHQPEGLFLVAGFGVWGVVLAVQTTTYYVAGLGMAVGLAGLLFKILLARFAPTFAVVNARWSWPWYVVALVAAIMVGLWNQLPIVTQPVGEFREYSLLAFAALAYVVGIVETLPECLWIGVGLASWSLIDVAWRGDLYRLFAIALICTVGGLLISVICRLTSSLAIQVHLIQRQKRLFYALPCYATALVAALLTGVCGIVFGINMPFYAAVPDALLVYALVTYGVLLSERRPEALFLVAGFGVWGVVLAVQTTAYYVAALGMAAGLAGLFFGPVIKILLARFTPTSTVVNARWSWPWYVIALIAAIMMGLWHLLPTVIQPASEFLEYSLLAFAALAYIIGIVEDMPECLWVGVGLASWSLIDVAWRSDLYRLFAIALISTVGGLLTFVIYRLASLLAIQIQQQKRIVYARPFYSIALVAAILTELPITAKWSVNSPFYAALPMALLFYALVAYCVSLLERKATWLWLVACFSLWGTFLFPQTYSCQWLLRDVHFSFKCSAPVYGLTAVALAGGLLGILAGRFIRGSLENERWLTMLRTKYSWNWPWYLTSLLAIGVAIIWNTNVGSVLPEHVWLSILGIFIVLWLTIMLVERQPESLLVVTILAVYTIAQTSWSTWQVMGAYSLLCVCFFALQFIWRIRPPKVYVLSPELLHCFVTIGGLVIVILGVILQGGLLPGSGMLAHVGVGSLCLLVVALFWYGHVGCLQTVSLEPTVQRLCYYGAGLLLSLVVSWEWLAFGQTDLSLLAIAPATYLIVVSSFLSSDIVLPQRERLGGVCAISGAIVLLLPTLWSSFSQQNLFPALLLAGEALLLCLVGIGMRVRFFVLSGVALVIVSGIHILFLPSLGIPSFLALAISGGLLLVSATGLMLIRSRLTSWS